MFQVPAYSFIPLIFKETLETKVAYIETSLVLGLSAGFVIGSAFFSLGGFFLPFYFVAALEVVIVILIWKIIPNKLEFD